MKIELVNSFRVTCSLFMCLLCQCQHKCAGCTQQQTIIYLDEPKATQPQKSLLKCPDHDLELQFYCESCEKLICIYCTMNRHANHSHGAIKEKAAKHRE